MTKETTLKISGMKCMHCAGAVRKALESVAGVESVDVNLERADAVVTGNADADALVKAIDKQGYEARVA